MKLEIKCLAPYLPYTLNVETRMGRRIMSPQYSNDIEVNINSVILYPHKPLLRPLSCLTKEIDFNGQKFIPIESSVFDKNDKIKLNRALKSGRGPSAIKELPYYMVDYLFFWHFDVFGLVNEGLAIKLI